MTNDLFYSIILNVYTFRRGVAQVVAHMVWDHGVGSSSLFTPNSKNKNLAREFGVSDETVEYNWTEQDVINALTTEPIDVLLDALDFGPEGIVQQLQTKAVELEIPDMDKREAIMKKTGFDISKMIKNKHV